MHEAARDEKVRFPSDRSLGFVFTAFFAIVALLPLFGGHDPLWLAATAFLLRKPEERLTPFPYGYRCVVRSRAKPVSVSSVSLAALR